MTMTVQERPRPEAPAERPLMPRRPAAEEVIEAFLMTLERIAAPPARRTARKARAR